ncbi:MAG: hypothetical protein Q4B13_04915 [Lautropia sp.]|nr:hypothetical protein [Lautropia sp.]
MRKHTLIQNLAIGLSALLLGIPIAHAADAGDVVQLIGPDNTVKSFQIDTDHVVQFGGRTLVRKASTAEIKQLRSLKGNRLSLKDNAGSAISPVLKDAAGRRYSLPGGLIVTLKEEMSETDGRALLISAGLKPERQITGRVWIVNSPAGLETINMANQQNAKGIFTDVSPNWWTKRALK